MYKMPSLYNKMHASLYVGVRACVRTCVWVCVKRETALFYLHDIQARIYYSLISLVTYLLWDLTLCCCCLQLHPFVLSLYRRAQSQSLDPQIGLQCRRCLEVSLVLQNTYHIESVCVCVCACVCVCVCVRACVSACVRASMRVCKW